MNDLELTRQRIREQLTKLNISANEASRRANLGLSYVNDLLVGKSKNPVPHRLGQLAEVLDCDLKFLMGQQDSRRAAARSRKDDPPEREPAILVPIFTVGLPSSDGYFALDEKIKSDIPILSSIVTPATYAVVVPDDSNAPRYFAGESVIVHPARPVSRGGYAVLRLKDGRATICRVDAILSDRVTVSRLETGAPTQVARDEIEAVHRIIGSAELT